MIEIAWAIVLAGIGLGLFNGGRWCIQRPYVSRDDAFEFSIIGLFLTAMAGGAILSSAFLLHAGVIALLG